MGSAQVAVSLLDHQDAGARHLGDGEHIDAGHQGLGYPQMSEIIDRDVLTYASELPNLPKALIDRILVPRAAVVLGEDRIVRLFAVAAPCEDGEDLFVQRDDARYGHRQ